MKCNDSALKGQLKWAGIDSTPTTPQTVCYLTEQRYSVFTAVAGGMFYHPPLSSTGGKLRATEHQSTVGDQEVVCRSCVAWIQS